MIFYVFVTQCDKYVQILPTCDKYEMWKIRVNKAPGSKLFSYYSANCKQSVFYT